MTDFKKTWTRMTDTVAAMEQPDSIEMPVGFATRVVAQAFLKRQERGLLEFLLPRVLGASFFIMLLTIASSFIILDNGYEDELLLADQLTAELFLQ
ncbi:MAG: hypothetical protein JKY51_06560 [Opitutaceae bacterium]|nr:hypothetical protein [Opitutaceae bacterium]